MQIVLQGDDVHEMLSPVFSWKYETNIANYCPYDYIIM